MQGLRAFFMGGTLLSTVLGISAGLNAQITVEGVTDKEVYADRVSFRVVTVAGYTYTATLDGAPVSTGVSVEVSQPDYHELVAVRENLTTHAKETKLVRFIVRASERKEAEVGLPPWTPYVMIPSAAAEFAGSTLRIIAPAAYPQGLEIPVVAWVVDGSGKRVGVNGQVQAPEFPGHDLQLLRGVGSTRLPAATAGGTISYTPRIQTLQTPKQIAVDSSTSWRTVSGSLAATEDWGENARIHVTGTLTVPAGRTLTIGAGSVVRLAGKADIAVNGRIVVNGTHDRPVVFIAAVKSSPWGSFLFRSSTSVADITGAIVTGGCWDPQWFDHNPGSGSTHLPHQPLIYASNQAHVNLTDTYLLDCPGQAGHGESSYFNYTRCLLQKFLTGGEYAGCIMNLTGCAIIEFPSESAPFADDDGDAIYFIGGSTIPAAYTVTDCLIGWAHDDGIDSGSGQGCTVKVYDTWVESDYHEALAWSCDSGTRLPDIRDTVTMNCGQGIEAGWGNPDVVATRCLSTANSVGARFGDNYDWDYNGSLKVTSSLLLHNKRDIWGRAWDNWEEHLSQMDLHDNYLTAADPLHPSNTVWSPAAHAALLEPFLPTPATVVGIGIAARTTQLEAAAAQAGIPVRLSTFTTHTVEVAYAIDAGATSLGQGTLEFAPGETVERIPIAGIDLQGRGTVTVKLQSPVGADLTGIEQIRIVQDTRITLFPAGSRWKYNDTGTDLGTAWRVPGYNDAAWKEGNAQLGCGDDGEVTVTQGCPDNTWRSAVYFRRHFDVASPASIESLTVRLKRDDGAVVYLNGVEVVRDNMPPGTIAYGTMAADITDGSSETTFFSHDVDAALLEQGGNVIAVEVHQANSTSSDLSFDLELLGRLGDVTPTARFLRGDSNADGTLDISDAVKILLILFVGDTGNCEDSMDVDDSGKADLSDAIYALNFLFRGGPAPEPPFPSPGEDPTADELGCDRT